MSVINRSGGTSRVWREVPTLFFKFSGSETIVNDSIARVQDISKKHEAQSFLHESDPHKQNALWSARKQALWSMMALRKGEEKVWSTDVAVPLSRVAELIGSSFWKFCSTFKGSSLILGLVDISKRDLVELGLFGSVLGHIGDGNFHETIMFEEDQRQDVEACVHRMVSQALDMEGTCTVGFFTVHR